MPIITPDLLVVEEMPVEGSSKPNRELWISEAAGLTQFGALIQELQPGSRSSIKHWHSSEDEMVYVLEGEISVFEGDQETLLHVGDAAAFKAGTPVGHFLWNRSSGLVRLLVVGTRSALDRITYPDHDRVCIRDRSLPDDIWTDMAGNPSSSPY
jgi:uncharacterized cupin superfamily protein